MSYCDFKGFLWMTKGTRKKNFNFIGFFKEMENEKKKTFNIFIFYLKKIVINY